MGSDDLVGPCSHDPDLHRMSKKYNVDAFTSYSTAVDAMTWDESQQTWRIDLVTPSGPRTDHAHFVINGHGVLNRPKVALFGGEENFQGKIMHTAEFDRGVEIEGKRVAVIGNGSSGIQTVGTIGYKVGELHSYQRSNSWFSLALDVKGLVGTDHWRVYRRVLQPGSPTSSGRWIKSTPTSFPPRSAPTTGAAKTPTPFSSDLGAWPTVAGPGS